MNRLFKIVYWVSGVEMMECAVRESHLVSMLSALIGSGFHIESVSVWQKESELVWG